MVYLKYLRIIVKIVFCLLFIEASLTLSQKIFDLYGANIHNSLLRNKSNNKHQMAVIGGSLFIFEGWFDYLYENFHKRFKGDVSVDLYNESIPGMSVQKGSSILGRVIKTIKPNLVLTMFETPKNDISSIYEKKSFLEKSDDYLINYFTYTLIKELIVSSKIKLKTHFLELKTYLSDNKGYHIKKLLKYLDITNQLEKYKSVLMRLYKDYPDDFDLNFQIANLTSTLRKHPEIKNMSGHFYRRLKNNINKENFQNPVLKAETLSRIYKELKMFRIEKKLVLKSKKMFRESDFLLDRYLRLFKVKQGEARNLCLKAANSDRELTISSGDFIHACLKRIPSIKIREEFCTALLNRSLGKNVTPVIPCLNNKILPSFRFCTFLLDTKKLNLNNTIKVIDFCSRERSQKTKFYAEYNERLSGLVNKVNLDETSTYKKEYQKLTLIEYYADHLRNMGKYDEAIFNYDKILEFVASPILSIMEKKMQIYQINGDREMAKKEEQKIYTQLLQKENIDFLKDYAKFNERLMQSKILHVLIVQYMYSATLIKEAMGNSNNLIIVDINEIFKNQNMSKFIKIHQLHFTNKDLNERAKNRITKYIADEVYKRIGN